MKKLDNLYGNLIAQTGLSNKDFAREIGVSPCTLTILKQGKNPQIKRLLSYCRKFGIKKIRGIENGCYIEIEINQN